VLAYLTLNLEDLGSQKRTQIFLSKLQEGRGCPNTKYDGDPTHTAGMGATTYNSWKSYLAIISLKPIPMR